MTILLLLLAVASGFSRSSEQITHDALVDAVRHRLGGDVEVVLDNLVIHTPIAAEAIEAVPEPDARLGSVIRFTLQAVDGSGPTGAASARVTAVAPHVHAVRAVERGSELSAGDVTSISHLITSGPLRALPRLVTAVGSKALRALAAGACISRTSIAPVPAVRTGQDVTAVATIDGVEARAVMVAAGNGDAGSVIRVVNRQSRRALKARVVSPGIVEIIK